MTRPDNTKIKRDEYKLDSCNSIISIRTLTFLVDPFNNNDTGHRDRTMRQSQLYAMILLFLLNFCVDFISCVIK